MNEVFISILCAVIFAQGLKIILRLSDGIKFSRKDFFVTGGMPSGHSALVVSLSTSIFLNEGITSLFAFSLVFMLIVLRDASGVRLSVGTEGDLIKKLIKKHNMKDKFDFSRGHTPLEVLIGSLIGFISAFGVYLIY